MKPWLLLFVFFPLYSQAFDIYIDPYQMLLESSKEERRHSYILLEDRLKLIQQRLLMIEMFMNDETPYALRKEYGRLKKDYESVKQTLIQLKER